MPKLNSKGTEYYTSHKLCSIDENGVNICPVEYVKNKSYKADKKAGKLAQKKVPVECGEAFHINCDAVVLSLGVKSNNNLSSELQGKYEGRVFTIGDAVKSGRIADATRMAYEVASKLK